MPVEDVDKKFKELKAKGVNFLTKPINKKEWRIQVAHFVDPERNIIELNSPIPA